MPAVLAAMVAIVALWWLLSVAVGGRIVPSPPVVAVQLCALVGHGLVRHALATLGRALAALLTASLAALPLALLLGRSRRADALFSPAAYLLYPVPKVALLPVFFLILGLGNGARIALVAIVLFFPILLTVRDGARNLDPGYFLSVRSLGARNGDVLRYLLIPALLPHFFTALRIGIGTALAVLFFAETFFTRFGLGALIMESWQKIDYPSMYAGILTLAILGLALIGGLDLLERRLCRWRRGL